MNRFKELRKELHLTQAELIKQYNERFNRTYSIPALSLFENGHRLPELPALKDFAEFFHCSVDYLIGRTDVRYHLFGDISDTNHPWRDHIKEHEQTSPTYYNDPEVAELADRLKNQPGMHMLFDASRNMTKQDIEAVVSLIKQFRGGE